MLVDAAVLGLLWIWWFRGRGKGKGKGNGDAKLEEGVKLLVGVVKDKGARIGALRSRRKVAGGAG